MTEHDAMSTAIDLAKKGYGRVSPNPAVGAVLLSASGEVLGKGYHEIFGGSHAEVNAIDCVEPKKLVGSTLVVTLEPCAHRGKTPSCASLIAGSPISKVVFGLVDPNPLVRGKGIEILKSSGKSVERISSFDNSLIDLNDSFIWRWHSNIPFMCIKMATTSDGIVVKLKEPMPQWITGSDTRAYVHGLRAKYDAVMVGRKTIETDDPQLNVRKGEFKGASNKVVVLDPSGALERI